FDTIGKRSKVQNHLALARLHAEFCGNESIQIDVQARLGVNLNGPTDEDYCEVILPPGERLEMKFHARDWCGRPLPRYPLHAWQETGYGMEDISLHLTTKSVQTDYPGKAVGPAPPAEVKQDTGSTQTDYLGR